MSRLIRELWFNLSYFLPGKPPWDSGVSPPELIAEVEGREGMPARAAGRALDLGCGTGTNVIYLAQHGWQAVGVDFVDRAVRVARRKAAAQTRDVAGRCQFHRGDVTRLTFLQPPFDLALDMGCFHSLELGQRPAYATELARLLRPGAIYMLYAFKPEAGFDTGVTEADLSQVFGAHFRLTRLEHGTGRPSTWFTQERL